VGEEGVGDRQGGGVKAPSNRACACQVPARLDHFLFLITYPEHSPVSGHVEGKRRVNACLFLYLPLPLPDLACWRRIESGRRSSTRTLLSVRWLHTVGYEGVVPPDILG